MQSSPDPEPPPPHGDEPGFDNPAGAEDRIEMERSDRAWQRQIDAEEADSARGSLYSAAALRWLLLAIAGVCLVMLLMDRLQFLG